VGLPDFKSGVRL